MDNTKFGGLNSFQLKIIALITMTIDHIGYFLSPVAEIPFWFRIIGRIAAPLFIFVSANSMCHTSSRLKYSARLYMLSLMMVILNSLVANIFYKPWLTEISNNIFSTIFCFCFIIAFTDMALKAREKRRYGAMLLYVAVLVLFFTVDYLKVSAVDSHAVNSDLLLPYAAAHMFLPTPSFAEGGIVFTLFGVAMYYFLGNKCAFAAMYIAFCLLFFIPAYQLGPDVASLFHTNYQWLMILGLPFIMVYNGQRGRGMKYLFYAYYPLHIYLLYILSYFM